MLLRVALEAARFLLDEAWPDLIEGAVDRWALLEDAWRALPLTRLAALLLRVLVLGKLAHMPLFRTHRILSRPAEHLDLQAHVIRREVDGATASSHLLDESLAHWHRGL